VHIQALAMLCLGTAGRVDEARRFAEAVKRTQPGYGLEDFMAAFRLGGGTEAVLRSALRRIEG
jgi:hypothetical protein